MTSPIPVLARSQHAVLIFKEIELLGRGPGSGAYYNELCRRLKLPRATINRYLTLLGDAGLIETDWSQIQVSEAVRTSQLKKTTNEDDVGES